MKKVENPWHRDINGSHGGRRAGPGKACCEKEKRAENRAMGENVEAMGRRESSRAIAMAFPRILKF